MPQRKFRNILLSVSPLSLMLSYPERRARFQILSRQKYADSSLTQFYITSVYTILSLLLAVSTLQYLIALHKREQVVVDCFVLYTRLNFMKTTSSIAVYRDGTNYHLQWSTLALFRVSNAFYRTLTCHFLLIVHIFNLL